MAEIYRHRGRRLWSVREGGRVVGHVEAIALVDVALVASEAGRRRCLRRGQREVVAWARGEVADLPLPAGAERLRYGLDRPGFRAGDGERPVARATAAWFEADGSAWCEGGE
ncbi:hypothetical protein SAMN02799631_03246 [Methylobacterium sp. 174MFSha1.1]|uniref:hypothetical protein n=1 Tax=Methylobacterium sp. 174MFSha1.1 TaxID=1502749 RepID=UPI0008E2408D|nr:hypothetical protein [Methylobacterium sp. 174MFSha1.1]SFU93483.1 hypothetical protein SAMN02799631_03246 [Methylobacterium sp. 174MFSha1.1]